MNLFYWIKQEKFKNLFFKDISGEIFQSAFIEIYKDADDKKEIETENLIDDDEN